jgi:biopolymer transport protein ExbD
MAADVGGDDGGGKKKGRKSSKGSPRVDMTPMVDLGFLLLTFFILTATMDNPQSMPIVVPADKEEGIEQPPPVAESKIMNIILTGDDRIFYYMGKPRSGEEGGMELKKVSYGKGIREKIIENKERLKKSKFATAEDPDPMIAMIKVADDARYANVVDILDEMRITRQTKYMQLDLQKEEAEILADYEKEQGLQPSVTKTLSKK